MGLGRTAYGLWGHKINIQKAMFGCGALCLFSYLLTALSPWPVLSLIGCMLCGLSSSLLWPGCYSLAAQRLGSNTTLFALLAMGGDFGCSLGPWLAGISSQWSENAGLSFSGLRFGLLISAVYPLILLFGLIILRKQK